jgi:hypothetical protein
MPLILVLRGLSFGIEESPLVAAEWIVGVDFNMVEWDGDQSGGRSSVIIGLEKHA